MFVGLNYNFVGSTKFLVDLSKLNDFWLFQIKFSIASVVLICHLNSARLNFVKFSKF